MSRESRKTAWLAARGLGPQARDRDRDRSRSISRWSPPVNMGSGDEGSHGGQGSHGDQGSDQGDQGIDKGDQGIDKGGQCDQGDQGDDQGDQGTDWSDQGDQGGDKGDQGGDKGDQGIDKGGQGGIDKGDQTYQVDKSTKPTKSTKSTEGVRNRDSEFESESVPPTNEELKRALKQMAKAALWNARSTQLVLEMVALRPDFWGDMPLLGGIESCELTRLAKRLDFAWECLA